MASPLTCDRHLATLLARWCLRHAPVEEVALVERVLCVFVLRDKLWLVIYVPAAPVEILVFFFFVILLCRGSLA